MEIVKCEGIEYCWIRIQKGDDIETITQRFSITPTSIIRNNPSIELYEGEMIKIVRKQNIEHIVKPMETLSDIANRYDVGVDDLIRVNSLTTKRLFIGQRLIVGKK